MLKKIAYSRIFVIMVSFALVIFLLSRCMERDSKKQHAISAPGYEQYAGSAACRNCHQDIYMSHLQTFHHQTSALASAQNIKGSTAPGKNMFFFKPGLFIAVEKKDSQLFQTAYKDGVEKISRPFDFVVGSGKRGQTFLYWYDSHIFQLPLTYFTSTDEWTNSPGYSNNVQFNRPITSRCLECHTTYLHEQSSAGAKAEEYSKSEILLGVECEKCHGPAKEHVVYHQEHSNEKKGHAVLNPGKMSRTQNLDLCRLCHGGSLTKSKPSFSFKAGDKLADYFTIDTTAKNVADIDVHGNQYGMLSASRCFTMSEMTCTSCHSPHQKQTGEKLLFASKCMVCHDQAGHKICKLENEKSAAFLQQNCIDCHMPELPSKAIMVLRQGESIPTSAYMRSHYITIYSEETKKILEKERERNALNKIQNNK